MARIVGEPAGGKKLFHFLFKPGHERHDFTFKMKNVQMNKLKSAQVSLGVIHSYETDWSGIPGFVQAVETVEEAVERILECGRVHGEQPARHGGEVFPLQTGARA